jgi:putative oxidoreductase
MTSLLRRYFLKDGFFANAGLLILRLSIGLMMIHHGQEKLADPATFAANYVAPLHLPFPLFFAQLAGFSELFGSWFVILGFLTPLGALALTGTMSVAAYQHILTSGLNIYVLELVVLYMGGSLAILLNGPGRFSFDAGIASGLLAPDSELADASSDYGTINSGELIPVLIRAEDSSAKAMGNSLRRR